MILLKTKEQEKLWNMVKPYLVVNGLDVSLREDAPQEIKETEILYDKLREEQRKEALEAMGLI